MDDNEDIDNQDWTDLMNLQDYKEIIESNWSVKKDDESFVTFEKEFAIPVSEFI